MGSGSPGYRIQLHSGRVSQAAHHLASPSRKGECQHAHGKINIKNYFNKLANTHWQNTRQCRISHQTWPVINNKKNLGTTQIQPHRALTGHWIVCTHVGRLKAPQNDFCISWRDEKKEETVEHLLCFCSALCRLRLKQLGSPFIDDLTEISEINLNNISAFIKSSGLKTS